MPLWTFTCAAIFTSFIKRHIYCTTAVSYRSKFAVFYLQPILAASRPYIGSKINIFSWILCKDFVLAPLGASTLQVEIFFLNLVSPENVNFFGIFGRKKIICFLKLWKKTRFVVNFMFRSYQINIVFCEKI